MNQQPPITMRPSGSMSPKTVRRLVIAAAAVIAAAIVAFSSLYTVQAGTESVVTRFDRLQSIQTQSGLHWKIPFIDKQYSVDVNRVITMEFGYRSASGSSGEFINSEAQMLTGDECLILCDWVVSYNVNNSYNYLFKVEDVDKTLRVICESAYRRVVASFQLDDVLMGQKDIIQAEIKDEIQYVCDRYELGVSVRTVQLQDAQPPESVSPAFLDVISAREEKNSKINQAKQYESENIPTARGVAAKAMNDAEAYAMRRINEAHGAVTRYQSIEQAYIGYPELMRKRLYMEMIADVLPHVKEIYFVDGNGNTLQFLPLTDSNSNSGLLGD